MTGKPLAASEGGVLNTDDRAIYERAVMFGHYERIKTCVQDPAELAVCRAAGRRFQVPHAPDDERHGADQS